MKLALQLAQTILLAFSLESCLTPPSSVHLDNKRLVQHLFNDVIFKSDFQEYKQLHSPDFICHSFDQEFTLDEDYDNAVAVQESMKGYQRGIVIVVAEGDYVAVHWKAESATEIVTGITLFKVVNGKITDEWPSLPHFKSK